MRKLNPALFDWQTWRSGSIVDLGIPVHRDYILCGWGNRIRQHAVGYCKGESLPCRPKLDTYAVMFWVKDRHFWTHFSAKLFQDVFYET